MKLGGNIIKLINKIRAFFRKNEENVELDLVAAEIREGKAFLHTKGEEPMTYMVRANDIEIRLNNNAVINEVDILAVKKLTKEEEKKEKQKAVKKKVPPAQIPLAENDPASAQVYDFDRFKKRKFTISVYPEEYAAIQTAMKEYGYKQSDFVLACINTATKSTMEKAHKKIVKTYREILLERQALVAKQIEDLAKNGEQTG